MVKNHVKLFLALYGPFLFPVKLTAAKCFKTKSSKKHKMFQTSNFVLFYAASCFQHLFNIFIRPYQLILVCFRGSTFTFLWSNFRSSRVARHEPKRMQDACAFSVPFLWQKFEEDKTKKMPCLIAPSRAQRRCERGELVWAQTLALIAQQSKAQILKIWAQKISVASTKKTFLCGKAFKKHYCAIFASSESTKFAVRLEISFESLKQTFFYFNVWVFERRKYFILRKSRKKLAREAQNICARKYFLLSFT